MNRILWLLVLSITLAAAKADQRDEDRRRDEPRVVLYQHADFRGDSLVLFPGETIDNFSGRTFANGNALNDSVSSIRVEGGAEVSIFEQARYRGPGLRLNQSVRDLSTRRLGDDRGSSWNDRISSIRVEKVRHRPGERAREIDGVISRAYHDLLGHEPDDRGLHYYRGQMTDRAWTDRMVRDHIRHGDEFRREGAERIVRRVYGELLRREPDETGLRDYRKLLIEQDWTEAEVRDSLRRSEEYQRKSGGH